MNIDNFTEESTFMHVLPEMVPCAYCGAFKLTMETSGLCCSNGKIKLKPFTLPPQFVKLYGDKTINRKLRALNAMHAFTSIGTNVDTSVNDRFTQCYRISGSFCHKLGSLQPTVDDEAKFAQIYMYDGDFQNQRRKDIFNNISIKYIKNIGREIRRINPYAKLFKKASEFSGDANVDMKIHLHNLTDRVYNKPTVKQVAAIILDGTEANTRDIIIKTKSDTLHNISELHTAYDPMQYPLLFPDGRQGWFPNMKNNEGKKITARQYYAYHGFSRSINKNSNPLNLAGPLVQQYYVDAYCKIETGRFRWIENNQQQLRLDTKENVTIAQENNERKVGKVVIPSGTVGTTRYYFLQFLDAMAGIRKYGSPDVFLTMTCNTSWQEIQRELKEGENAQNRPMLIARVFREKLKALVKRVKDRCLFGKVVAHVHTIEMQKRGLPHAHLIIILDSDSKMQDKEDLELDKYVFAEIPDKQKTPKLYKMVAQHMIHKPCDEVIDCACILPNGTCKANYPKHFNEITYRDEQGYTIYRRRNNGRKIGKRYNGKLYLLDNTNIVPYNPELLLEFNCHINVEIVASYASVKYLFKYLHKGNPKSTFYLEEEEKQNAEDEHNQIKKFQTGRYISPGDACWRILGFPLVERNFVVERLPVHLENQEIILFEGDSICRPLRYTRNEDTKLTAFFKFCASNKKLKVLYENITDYAVYNKSTRTWNWKKREVKNKLSRLQSVKPKQIERFCFRILLTHVESPTSFKSLRTYKRKIYPTYQEAAIARGLFDGDEQTIQLLAEASEYETPYQLRNTFGSLLLFCSPVDPRCLFERFLTKMTEDYIRNGMLDIDLIRGLAAYDIDRILTPYGLRFWDFIPNITMIPPQDHIFSAPEDSEQSDKLLRDSFMNLFSFTEEQDNLYQCVQDAWNNYDDKNTQKCFIVQSAGGCGKTFWLNGLIAQLFHLQIPVIATATAAIASSLLIDGLTSHAAFHLPIEYFDRYSTCNISAKSQTANQLRHAKIIIVDEVTMIHRYLLEALHRTLKDIMDNNSPFGGKIVILSGDFQQTLPIVSGSRGDVVRSCITASYLWKYFKTMKLTKNLRCKSITYNKFLTSIGQGTYPSDVRDYVELPQMVQTTNSTKELCSIIYPNLHRHMSSKTPPIKYFSDRIILAPHHTTVQAMEDMLRPANYHSMFSRDTIDKYNTLGPHLPPDVLNRFQPSGFPPHELKISINMPIILLRNINKKLGLCNGTRAIITKIKENTIQAVVTSGRAIGKHVSLFRITFKTNAKHYVAMNRVQFPCQPCFAMTINKSQGQTLKIVGVNLQKSVFSHGQLYTALSRVKEPDKLFMYCEGGGRRTQNIVYHEILTN